MDENLIELIKREDFQGLELLIEEYGSSIMKTISSVLSYPYEKSSIDDVMNETLYQIFTKIHTYNPEKSSLQTWLLVVARNRSIDEKRKLFRQRNTTVNDDEEGGGEEARVLEKESFLELIDRLSEEDQKIFLYCYFYQFSAKEIAEILNLSEEKIYNRLSRGRKKLKEMSRGGTKNEWI